MKHTVTMSGTAAQVALTGEINDGVDGDFERILSDVQEPAVVVDCAGVEAMNSVGIASWCAFVKRLERGRSVAYREVPAIMVHFAGMVGGFFGRAGVLASVRVPYYCSACRKGSTPTLETGALRAAGTLPQVPCPQCRASLAPEVDVEGFMEALRSCAPGG